MIIPDFGSSPSRPRGKAGKRGGAVILARAVASEGTRKEILRANRAHLDVLLDMLSKVKTT